MSFIIKGSLPITIASKILNTPIPINIPINVKNTLESSTIIIFHHFAVDWRHRIYGGFMAPLSRKLKPTEILNICYSPTYSQKVYYDKCYKQYDCHYLYPRLFRLKHFY